MTASDQGAGQGRVAPPRWRCGGVGREADVLITVVGGEGGNRSASFVRKLMLRVFRLAESLTWARADEAV